MTANHMDTEPLEEPLAELERQLIGEYLSRAGQDYHTLLARSDDDARRLLSEASVYAAGRLTEVESRSHYLKHLRGQE